HVEVGSITALPKRPNKKAFIRRILGPSLLNDLGLPNEGVTNIERRIRERPRNDPSILGVNIGILEHVEEFSKVARCLQGADYFTLNLSCPNHAPKAGSDIELKNALRAVVAQGKVTLVKLSPDMWKPDFNRLVRFCL